MVAVARAIIVTRAIAWAVSRVMWWTWRIVWMVRSRVVARVITWIITWVVTRIITRIVARPPIVGVVAYCPVPVVPRVVWIAPPSVVEGVYIYAPAIVPGRRVDAECHVRSTPSAKHRGDILRLDPHLVARDHNVVVGRVVGRSVEHSVAGSQVVVARW